MDVDTLITYLFLFLFFVLPSILKRRGKGKKAAKKAKSKIKAKKAEVRKAKKKKPNLFDRLGDAIREAVRELEEQAREAKRKQQQEGQEKEGGSAWDLFDDRDENTGDLPALERETDVPDPLSSASDADDTTGARPGWPTSDPHPRSYDPDHPFVAPRKAPLETQRRIKVSAPPIQETPAALPVRAALPSHALQQAVVWSEILGKPKGLQ